MGSRWTPSKYVVYGLKEDNYEWTQTPEEVIITVQVPPNLCARDLIVDIKPNHLRLVVKASSDSPIIDGDLCKAIELDESTWTKDSDIVEISLGKGSKSKGQDEGQWWSCAIVGHRELDTKRIEGTKYLDESLLKKIWEREQEEEEQKKVVDQENPEEKSQ